LGQPEAHISKGGEESRKVALEAMEAMTVSGSTTT
jgi:hypothetical protein